jgi:hypothetical protein
MAHSHNFHHQAHEDGFDGLGVNEQRSVDEELSGTVYYTITSCDDRHCPVDEYRSWLFEINSFTLCCDEVHPDEPTASFETLFEDFRHDDEPITVTFTCRHCGETQTLESDHIYSSES